MMGDDIGSTVSFAWMYRIFGAFSPDSQKLLLVVEADDEETALLFKRVICWCWSWRKCLRVFRLFWTHFSRRGRFPLPVKACAKALVPCSSLRPF
jgi:hypothetical protein